MILVAWRGPLGARRVALLCRQQHGACISSRFLHSPTRHPVVVASKQKHLRKLGSNANSRTASPPHADGDNRILGTVWKKASAVVVGMLTTAAITYYYSSQARQFRHRQLAQLPILTAALWKQHYPHRYYNHKSLLQTVERMGLMGTQRSVKAELETIREWHVRRGFKGALVVRDLTRPVFGGLFGVTSNNPDDAMQQQQQPQLEDWTVEEILQDPTRLERRECYYLYYEIEPTGKVVQEIFCRGTTLFSDILTCIQAWTVFDPDLQCSLHRGFLNHANLILRDVLPLLAPPSRIATVELSGHSLGGSVAAILAAKLKKRGYNVIRLTTVGEPRFLKSPDDARVLQQHLPEDHLRIEDDRDIVPFLPPSGAHVGNKLWLGNEIHFVVQQQQNSSWTDSVWTNFMAWEILSAKGRPHRIPSYVQKLATARAGEL